MVGIVRTAIRKIWRNRMVHPYSWQRHVDYKLVEKIVEQHPQYVYIMTLINNKHACGDIMALADAIQKLFEIIEGAALADYMEYREHAVIRYSVASLIPSIAFVPARIMSAPIIYLWIIAGTSITMFVIAGWYKFGTRHALFRIHKTSQFRKTMMLQQYLKNLGYEAVVDFADGPNQSANPTAFTAL